VKAPILTPWRTVDRGPDAPDCEALHADEPTARAYLDALPPGRVAVSCRAHPCQQRGSRLVPVEPGWPTLPAALLRPRAAL